MGTRKALILKMGAIGDVIMTLPSVRALYEQGFEIHWICGNAVRQLLECYSWINLIPVDDEAILAGGIFGRVWGIFGLWKRIVFRKYELCATLQYDPRYRLLVLPVWARRKLALSRKSRSTTLLTGRSYANEYVRVLLGREDDFREEGVLPVRPDRLPLSPLPPRVAPRRIGIVPGGASNFHRQLTLRRWPIESYVALAEELRDRGWEVLLIGGRDDAWVKPHFQHLAVTDCIDKLSLTELISTCDSCDAVVSHDTGPLHIAGLSRACLLGLFGPTDPGSFLPRRSYVVGIWGGQGFACRPCYDGHHFAPCKSNKCIQQVTPNLVIDELERLLDARSREIPGPWRIVLPGSNGFANPTEIPTQPRSEEKRRKEAIGVRPKLISQNSRSLSAQTTGVDPPHKAS